LLAPKPVVLAATPACPTAVFGVAVVEPVAEPVMPEVASDSPLTKPLMVSVNAGLAWPYRRLWLSAVTVRCALLMVKVPSVVEAVKS
jgi:hypothetical protein